MTNFARRFLPPTPSSPRTINLVEYSSKTESFSPTPEERSVLSRFAWALKIRVTDANTIQLAATDDFIGSVSLSPNTHVVVRPRFPITSLLQLILIAFDTSTLSIFKDLGSYTRGTLVDWLAMMLVLEIRRLIAHGLRRGYTPAKEPLNLIRGRIDFLASFRTSWDASKLVCIYRPFNMNTAENVILKATLAKLAAHRLLPEIRNAVDETYALFEDVAYRPITVYDFERIQINRLNKEYDRALALCRTFAQGAALAFGAGESSGDGFFLSMNEIFERAITNALRREIPHVLAQRRINPVNFLGGAPILPVNMKPDITIMAADNNPVLVVDAKNKKPILSTRFGPRFRNADIYQIVSYAKALSCRGLLVYPQIEEPVDVLMQLQDITFGIATIDLQGDVTQSLRAFATRVLAITHNRFAAGDFAALA